MNRLIIWNWNVAPTEALVIKDDDWVSGSGWVNDGWCSAMLQHLKSDPLIAYRKFSFWNCHVSLDCLFGLTSVDGRADFKAEIFPDRTKLCLSRRGRADKWRRVWFGLVQRTIGARGFSLHGTCVERSKFEVTCKARSLPSFYRSRKSDHVNAHPADQLSSVLPWQMDVRTQWIDC